ncbi:HNH endonuclease [Microbacterium mangrovi]|uniref:HNH endonuclease n=1 Tax=Microbacterium mangrovi TaxID=1348253 RepID=UPI001E2CD975|nr:HNH endonuclease signature motif containing protein [Microbacterium mangrovi]
MRPAGSPAAAAPPEKCDIDHTIAHSEGGPTALCNLACLCERHHTVKHHTDWTVQQLPGGILQFTSPTRRAYRTRPPGAVRFTPDRPPGTPPDTPPGRALDRQPDAPSGHSGAPASTRIEAAPF